jgi:Uma2 family endonuclease
MAGGSPRHNALSGRVVTELSNALRGRNCTVFTSDQRVGFMARTRYVYPDVTVTCGPLELESNDVLLNPQVIVEVLSTATEPYDRGLKWDGYQRIPSLQDYVLVSQTTARIEQYQRAPDSSWTYRAVEAGGRIVLTNGATLAVDDLFAGVFELPGDSIVTLLE